ncbi:hypothetical protein EHE19_013795 [Ruminiclostridium herbifermentans]|uniref:Uncharacterized protein n=1 Tax=Ruminiclostridium herbifermentans TaxID=2488810 RepID=A0A7H1VKP2_9FIRM|nr:hypothetical protein [Ruminiclostridium herbifermentans]QNU65954.1 hypothetical protein EHE19_013795 [Ruminiclostridium herbifermentans]
MTGYVSITQVDYSLLLFLFDPFEISDKETINSMLIIIQFSAEIFESGADP